jgi:hypothetical protein
VVQDLRKSAVQQKMLPFDSQPMTKTAASNVLRTA